MHLFRKIGFNFLILSLVQFLNLAFPLVLYFLLINRLTIANVGIIISWQMVFSILASISNYNFPLLIIPIAEKLKRKRIHSIYWNRLLQIRFFITSIIFLSLVICAIFLPSIALISSMLFFGKLLNPSLFFTVMSKNKQLLFYNFFTRFLSLLLIYLCISRTTYEWTNFIIGISEFVISVLLLKHLKWRIHFKLIKFSKFIQFIKKERLLFYIQSVNALIIMVTIPLTHLFFGAYTAGVVSILEKILTLIRGISGNLFFSILPQTWGIKNRDTLTLKTNPFLKKTTIIIVFTALISIVLLSTIIIEKFNRTMPYYLALTTIAFIPIILSTSFQIQFFKYKYFKTIFSISKIHFLVLVFSFLLLGYWLDIYGIILSIIIHEFFCYYAYKKKSLHLHKKK